MTYAKRVTELEGEGLTTSDAQAVADAEAIQTIKAAPRLKPTPGPYELVGKLGTAIWAGNKIVAQINEPREKQRQARADAEFIKESCNLVFALARMTTDEDENFTDEMAEYWADDCQDTLRRLICDARELLGYTPPPSREGE